jgi:surface-anchored protein
MAVLPFGRSFNMKVSLQWKLLIVCLGMLAVLDWPVRAQDHDHDYDHRAEVHGYQGRQAHYLAEHGDFAISYADAELAFHIHLHAGAFVDGNALDEDTVFAPEQLIVAATEAAESLRPAGELWEPTGVDVNEAFWVLPQHEQEDLPALGFTTADIGTGVFVDDQVQLNLRAIQGPGDFSLWEDNAFGLPSFYLATHERQNSATFSVGLHAHYNWTFSAPGDYILVFEATAELVAGGLVDALSIFHFKVIEDPLCLAFLPGDLNGDCVVDEHDLHLVEDNLGNTARTWPMEGDHEHGREDSDQGPGNSHDLH